MNRLHAPSLHRFLPRRGAGASLALLAGLLGSACAAPPAVPPAGGQSAVTQVPASNSAALMDQIRAQIGSASCTANAQCRSVAVGAKACGGPEAYLAWSTAVSNEARLKAAVAAHAQARQREDEQSGRMSNCMMLADPGARCEAGRCQLNAPSSGSGNGSPVM